MGYLGVFLLLISKGNHIHTLNGFCFGGNAHQKKTRLFGDKKGDSRVMSPLGSGFESHPARYDYCEQRVIEQLPKSKQNRK